MEPDGNNMSITSVFQDFNKYKATLKENIGLSDVQRLAELTDEEVFEQCKEIDLSGIADIENAEQILLNDFGGMELSLGNWQRISLLRSLYRKCDTVLLDEPTSAIDTLEETRIFNYFFDKCTDMFKIIITHRLGVAKHSDLIIVLDKGLIIDQGTHEELISKKGRYYKMYQAQANIY